MTVSILDTLATLPSGHVGPRLDFAELGDYLRTHLNTESERERNRHHVLRDEAYRDGGVAYMKSWIDTQFRDATVRELRKKQVEHTRFNNPVKRTVNQISTVYAEPAVRTVDGEDNDQRYQTVLRSIRFDEYSLQLSRLLNLHRALVVGFRVRKKPDGTREPVIDIATPASVRAVMHPNDDKYVLGWLIRCQYKPARLKTDVPSWVLWTDHETVHLREDFSVIVPSYQEHGLGVCPWVGVTLGPPQPGFWPGSEGADLVAAWVSTWMANILLIKESNSATKQNVIAGDGSQMSRGQAADSTVPIELQDGQSVSTIDNSMDLEMFQGVADHIIDGVALNYGVSGALLKGSHAESAEARELLRLPLKELRRHQHVPLRIFEEQLAIVMAAVLRVDMPELAFEPLGWRMRFGEPEIFMSPKDKIDLFLSKRAIGADNIIEYLMRENPGMTWDQAVAELETNIAINLFHQFLIRPTLAITGAAPAQDQPPSLSSVAPVIAEPPAELVSGDSRPANPAVSPAVGGRQD